MNSANLRAVLIGVLLIGSILYQVSTATKVSDLTERVQVVERTINCEEKRSCRQFIKRIVLQLTDVADQVRRIRGGDASNASTGNSPSAPGNGGSGPTPNPPSPPPPNPPPPNPPPPNPPPSQGPIGDLLDDLCTITSPLGVCLN